MEKNITVNMTWAQSATMMVEQMVQRAENSLSPLTHYYSEIMERPLNSRQTMHLVHAQLAFFFAAFPVDGPLTLRAAAGLWFWWAVKTCKKELRRAKR